MVVGRLVLDALQPPIVQRAVVRPAPVRLPAFHYPRPVPLWPQPLGLLDGCLSAGLHELQQLFGVFAVVLRAGIAQQIFEAAQIRLPIPTFADVVAKRHGLVLVLDLRIGRLAVELRRRAGHAECLVNSLELLFFQLRGGVAPDVVGQLVLKLFEERDEPGMQGNRLLQHVVEVKSRA